MEELGMYGDDDDDGDDRGFDDELDHERLDGAAEPDPDDDLDYEDDSDDAGGGIGDVPGVMAQLKTPFSPPLHDDAFGGIGNSAEEAANIHFAGAAAQRPSPFQYRPPSYPWQGEGPGTDRWGGDGHDERGGGQPAAAARRGYPQGILAQNTPIDDDDGSTPPPADNATHHHGIATAAQNVHDAALYADADGGNKRGRSGNGGDGGVGRQRIQRSRTTGPRREGTAGNIPC